MRLLNFKKPNKKSKVKSQLPSIDYRQSASSTPNVNSNKLDEEDGLYTINCDVRVSLLEDIMRELHKSNQQYQQPRQNQNAQAGQEYIGLQQGESSEPPPAAVASTFVSPSSKEGDQNGVGPFSSPPVIENDTTPTFTTPISSSLITSPVCEKTLPPATPKESDHDDNRSLKTKGKKKKSDQGLFFNLPKPDSQPPSKRLSNSYHEHISDSNTDKYEEVRISKNAANNEKRSTQYADGNDYQSTQTQETTTNNDNEKSDCKKQHLFQAPPYPDRLRKELQLLETGKKSYSVPDFSILRHDWKENSHKSVTINDSKQCQQEHQHYHYHHHYTLFSNPICQHEQSMYQHPQYHNNNNPSPSQQQESQPNNQHHHHHYKNFDINRCHHYHHHFDTTENDKQQLDSSGHHHPIPFLHCHQHIPYIVSPCVTKFPSLSSTRCSCYQ